MCILERKKCLVEKIMYHKCLNTFALSYIKDIFNLFFYSIIYICNLHLIKYIQTLLIRTHNDLCPDFNLAN